nr:PAS domain S-box protein [uncultured Methanoregula sp.]
MLINTSSSGINKILYVDDEPALLDIGKLFLEEDGSFFVDTSLSAPDALALLGSCKYDAIVSDYQMPRMDGIAFLKTLRTQGDMTPFIIFTGRGREDVVIEALNSGADFYLQKGGEPVSQFTELAHKILHAISQKRADLALQKSERDYRHLIEHAGEGIFVIQDERLRMINKRVVELSGYSEQELVNQPFVRFVHPDEAGMLLEKFRNRSTVFSGPAHFTFRIICRDATVRWVELNVVAITWNERPAILNYMIDVTDRKQTENALRESEERYRTIFESFEDLYYQTDIHGIITILSPSVYRLTGYTEDELIGKPVSMIYVNPADRGLLLDEITKNGNVRDYEVLLRRKDGTQALTSLSANLISHADGTPAGVAGSLRDITRRKRAEDALRESEVKFRSLVDHAFEAILITDLQGTVLFANPATARTLDADDSANLIGRNVMDFIAPESRADVAKDFEEVARGHDAYVARYHLITLEGRDVFVESIGKVITYEGKTADIISLRDVTGQNRTRA